MEQIQKNDRKRERDKLAAKAPCSTGLTSEVPQGETTELLRKKVAQQAYIRDALKSQMSRRQQYVDQDKQETREIEQALLDNNSICMERERKKKEDEKAQVLEFWSKEQQFADGLKAMQIE